MDKNRTAAVVVTYNRLTLLNKCIEKLRGQTVPCDILVVDNASTDGTTPWLREQEEAGLLRTRNTGGNLGGAGGFNKGMRWAVEDGYKYLWLMDDDCLPEQDALEKLLEADSLLNGSYGWLSSVALWTDGNVCSMNIQRKTPYQDIDGFASPLTPCVMASFAWKKTLRRCWIFSITCLLR
jgi:glycosyltransferase involved in cell wall biosynthesis